MPAVSKMTLVMVDDNADEIFIARDQMRRDGIINDFISERKPENILKTLSQLGETGVDKSNVMVLLDINMPRCNGFETLKKIRADREFKDVPVIMLSASDDHVDMFEAIELGASGYIVKPFKADEFFAALTNVPQVKYQLVSGR